MSDANADSDNGSNAHEGEPDVEMVMVTMRFQAADPERLLAVLSKYVVISRGQNGCRNIDLAASTTTAGELVIVQKWTSADDQRRHFDSPAMVDMAESCHGILSEAPQIDLLEPISAHDLK